MIRGIVPAWLIALLLLGCSSASSLKRIDDEQIARLPATEKVLVINFWATWCVPCRTEIPALNRLREKYPDVRFVGVNLDDPENEGAIPGFLKEHPIHYEVLRRTGQDFAEAAASMDPEWKGGIPATFVFLNGKQIYTRIGMIQESELDGILQESAAGVP